MPQSTDDDVGLDAEAQDLYLAYVIYRDAGEPEEFRTYLRKICDADVTDEAVGNLFNQIEARYQRDTEEKG